MLELVDTLFKPLLTYRWESQIIGTEPQVTGGRFQVIDGGPRLYWETQGYRLMLKVRGPRIEVETPGYK